MRRLGRRGTDEGVRGENGRGVGEVGGGTDEGRVYGRREGEVGEGTDVEVGGEVGTREVETREVETR